MPYFKRKETDGADWSGFSAHVQQMYANDPAMEHINLGALITEVKDTRKHCVVPGFADDAALERLINYYKELVTIWSRVGDGGVKFRWLDVGSNAGLFDKMFHKTEGGFGLERRCTLFQMAWVCAEMASRDEEAAKSDGDALKRALQRYKKSGRILLHCRDSVEVNLAKGCKLSHDLRPESLNALARIMFAKAGRCMYEGTLKKTSDPSMLARVASVAHRLFLIASAHCKQLDCEFSKLAPELAIDASVLESESHSAMGAKLFKGKDRKYGLGVAHYHAAFKAASSTMEKAQALQGAAAVQVKQRAQARLSAAKASFNDANRENNDIYHEPLPRPEEAKLPTQDEVNKWGLEGPLSEVAEFRDIDSVSSESPWARLKPVMLLRNIREGERNAEVFVEEKASVIDNINQDIDVALAGFGLPALLFACMVGDSACLPDPIKDKISHIQESLGGKTSMDAMITQLREMSRETGRLISGCVDLLDEERKEDDRCRDVYGSSWTRPTSKEVATAQYDEVEFLSERLAGALKTDEGSIHKYMDMCRDGSLTLLMRSPEQLNQELSKYTQKPEDVRSETFQALKSVVEELQEIRDSRVSVSMTIKKEAAQAVGAAIEGGQSMKKESVRAFLEERFSEALSMVASSEKRQKELCSSIAPLVEDFNKARMHMSNPDIEKFLLRIQTASAMFEQLHRRVGEGVDWYVKLQDKVRELQSQCDDFVLARRLEKEESEREARNSHPPSYNQAPSSGPSAPPASSPPSAPPPAYVP